MAIRSGAIAAIIDGATRDKKATSFLDFPVYCKSYNAQDVRRRATLDYYQKPIKIQNVIVNPGDLLFMDDCGLVVIYQKYEKEIIDRVLTTFQTEKSIIMDIVHGCEVKEIVDKNGNF